MNLRMAKQSSKRLHNSLIQRKNIFKLSKFENFCNSSNCEKLITKLRSKERRPNWRRDGGLPDPGAPHQPVPQTAAHLQAVQVGKSLRAKLQKLRVHQNLQDESAPLVQVRVKRYNFDDVKVSQYQKKTDFLLLSVFLFISFQVKHIFVYWIDTKKFNWQNFKENYKNMPNSQLLSIIETMNNNL